MSIEKGRFTRRTVIGAIGAGLASLWLPVSLEENVDYVRRFWALDQSMVAAQSIAGDGHIVLANGGRVWLFTREPIIGNAPVAGIIVGGYGMDVERFGEEATVTGAAYVYRTDERHERPGLAAAFDRALQ